MTEKDCSSKTKSTPLGDGNKMKIEKYTESVTRQELPDAEYTSDPARGLKYENRKQQLA